MNSKPHIAVVGATGAVGVEMIKTLERSSFRTAKLTLLASSRSVGRKLKFHGDEIAIKELGKDSFQGIDIALFSAGASISKEFAPIAAKAGCVVIDNSSAFRMDEKVPLVIPEINASDVKGHEGIIANPNCTTAVTLMALYPLHRAFSVKRIFASSYQAVSGTGAKAIEELRRQIEQSVNGKDTTKEVYPHQIAFNVLPHVDSFLPSGYTKEEMKMENEGRKIMHHPAFRASVTCVRVPVYRAHSVAVNAEFDKLVTVESARAVLSKAPATVRLLTSAATIFLKSHFAELAIQRGLELLQIRGRGTIAGLLWKQAQAASLIEIPIGGVAVAEGYFAADDRAGTSDLIHAD